MADRQADAVQIVPGEGLAQDFVLPAEMLPSQGAEQQAGVALGLRGLGAALAGQRVEGLVQPLGDQGEAQRLGSGRRGEQRPAQQAGCGKPA
ncbi:hypothetical protein [Azotobacter chroococcum]|uniref:hypothetical protein n=1 Tax=Azotobacter chroococcum TaxID=353 RepID=UPI001E40B86E|nr:hypothetical protein [Azotobacter chroococcum]